MSDLPAHHYGVHVANDMDARRLRYLVKKKGAEKNVANAYMYSQKYPGSRIFVSMLLKRYGVKVPARVYAAVNVPIYRVYLLLHPATSKLKIGFSGDWLDCAPRFECDFDLNLSIGSDKGSAIAAEKIAKSIFQSSRTEPPPVPFGAGGRTEWFSAVIYDAAAAAISSFNIQHKRLAMTLRNALANDLQASKKYNDQRTTQ